MATHTNDNLNPWRSIGWQAALIVNRLRCQAQILELQTESPQNIVKDDETGADQAAEKKKEDKHRFIERRLRELADFERRCKGIKI